MTTSSKARKPIMWILAGVNGAGKTSLYEQKVKEVSSLVKAPFVNADNIEAERWPNEIGQHSLEAAKLADEERKTHLKNGQSFVAESAFTHPSKLELVKDAQQAGFEVRLFHVNLRSADLAIKRVHARVAKGGHGVPDDKVRKRYENIKKVLPAAAKIADVTRAYDNSLKDGIHREVLHLERGVLVKAAPNIPKWAREMFAEPLKNVSLQRQNEAAHSFSQAQEITKKALGVNATVAVPKKDHTYRGPIIGETSRHVLQQVGRNKVVAHFTSKFEYPPKLGHALQIRYQEGKIKRIKPIVQDKDRGR